MHSPRPSVVGVVLVVYGLLLGLLLALAQGTPSAALPLLSIAGVLIAAALSISFGLFMILRHRGVRTDTGVR